MKEEEVEVEAEAEVRTKINIHTLEKQKISQHLETREIEIKIKEAVEEAKIGYIQTIPKESQKETLDKTIKIWKTYWIKMINHKITTDKAQCQIKMTNIILNQTSTELKAFWKST